MSELVIRHGPVRRGRRTVLNAGEIRAPLPANVAVVGINGSGKSSLFMLLADALSGVRSRPSIHVGDRRPTMGYSPQAPALPGWLDADRIAALYGTTFARLCAEMPGLYLGELSGRRAATWSLGERQAFAFGLALARDAALTILDEPFSALDFRRRVGGLALLRRWRDERPDRALLLASQNAADLLDVCDHFVVIRSGRYVFNGARSTLTGSARDAAAVEATEAALLRLLG